MEGKETTRNNNTKNKTNYRAKEDDNAVRETTAHEGPEQERRSDENLAKIAITKEADRAVSDILLRVNDGFEAGKASKQEITSYIVLRFYKGFTENDLHGIRALFFNPILLMETMVRKAKETGELPDSLRTLLYEQFNSQHAPKRTKKSLKDDAILDSLQKEGAA